jgi:hypothetical protein
MDPWTWKWELLAWAINTNVELCKQTFIKQNVHQGIPQEEHDKSQNYSTCPTIATFNNHKELPTKLSLSHPRPLNNHDYINKRLLFMVSYSFFCLQFLLPPLSELEASF